MSDKNRIWVYYLIPVMIFAVFLGIYVSFLTKSHAYYKQDAYEHMYWANSETVFSAPTVSGYMFLGKGFYKIWKFFGWQQSAMVPFQVLSALSGAFGVLVFYFILLKITGDRITALLFTFLMGFSNAYWFFSTESINRIPGIMFVLLAFLLMFFVNGRFRRVIPFLMGIVLSVGVICEFSSILYLVLFCLGLIFIVEGRGRLAGVLVCFILSTLVLLTIYYSQIWFLHRSFSFYGMTLEVKRRMLPEYGGFLNGLHTLAQAVVSKYDRPGILASFAGHWFQRFVLFVITLGAVFTSVYAVFSTKNIVSVAGKTIKLCVIWVIVAFSFICYQESGCLEYYINLLVPFWLIPAIGFWYSQKKASIQNAVKVFYIFSALLLFINNLVFSIYPLSKLENSDYYCFYKFVKNNTKSDDLLIVYSNHRGAGQGFLQINEEAGSLAKNIMFFDVNRLSTRKFYRKLIQDLRRFSTINVVCMLYDLPEDFVARLGCERGIPEGFMFSLEPFRFDSDYYHNGLSYKMGLERFGEFLQKVAVSRDIYFSSERGILLVKLTRNLQGAIPEDGRSKYVEAGLCLD
jgi:hypothetical protein